MLAEVLRRFSRGREGNVAITFALADPIPALQTRTSSAVITPNR